MSVFSLTPGIDKSVCAMPWTFLLSPVCGLNAGSSGLYYPGCVTYVQVQLHF